jgi:hypothetical protein
MRSPTRILWSKWRQQGIPHEEVRSTGQTARRPVDFDRTGVARAPRRSPLSPARSSPQCLHKSGRFGTIAVHGCRLASRRQLTRSQGVSARTPVPSISCAKWPDPVRFLPGSPPQLHRNQQLSVQLDWPQGHHLHNISTRKRRVAGACACRRKVFLAFSPCLRRREGTIPSCRALGLHSASALESRDVVKIP